jgi:hypothetical protein
MPFWTRALPLAEGVSWYTEKAPSRRKMIPQILKAQPAGVKRVGYASETARVTHPWGSNTSRKTTRINTSPHSKVK